MLPNTGVKKVTVNLPEDQINFLQETAKRDHITVTDVLRRSINSERFFVEQERMKRKILVEAAGEPLREVIRK
jgi:hypothetical protein